MDYETADGSQFSMREIWRENGDVPKFKETLITALVEGKPYAGRSQQLAEDIDEADILQILEAVPIENIFPEYADHLLHAPEFDAAQHYLKAPQFTYEDIQPGQTFVADNLLQEAQILEQLSRAPHPNVVDYYGCVVQNGRITHLCLRRSGSSLTTYAEAGITEMTRENILTQIRAGLVHLHSLGLAHNDINPDNICIDDEGRAVIVDFDSCIAIGARLRKGVASIHIQQPEAFSHPHNDFDGLRDIEDFLYDNTIESTQKHEKEHA